MSSNSCIFCKHNISLNGEKVCILSKVKIQSILKVLDNFEKCIKYEENEIKIKERKSDGC